MILKKKNHFKPLYKQFFKLRENVQNRTKLLKFKSKKWEQLIKQYKKKLKRYKKYKPQDQTKYIVSKYPSKNNSYKKRFKNTLNASKKFRVFYGGMSKKYIKKQIRYVVKNKRKSNIDINTLFLELFEQRLDTVLYRSKFSISIRNAKQLILHEKVLVNKNIIRTPSYLLKTGDLITIDPKFAHLIERNIKKAQIWQLPPKYLSINYKTMEIAFHGNIQQTNLSLNVPFHLNLEKVLVDYYRH